MPVLIETHEENSVQWGVSFTDHNPEHKDYVECATREDAERLMTLLRDRE